MSREKGGLELPAGFAWASGTAGLKRSGKPDLALALAPRGATAAAVFTKNLVAAAPVVLGRAQMKKTGGSVEAVVVNAGNANCATGAHGMKAARAVCAAVAKQLGTKAEAVFPSSTGVIGVPLRYEKIVDALPALLQNAGAAEEHLRGFAAAIMTTDTRMKLASTKLRVGGMTVRIVGVAKGSGMIHPNMATMLAYIFTDAAVAAPLLRRSLKGAVDESFNAISVDGDTSTNDTVLLLANGASGARVTAAAVGGFQRALREVCGELARQIVADGEGVQHVVTVKVEGARSDADAAIIARAIATSALIKTAWAGADPNWGRLIAAAGRSGARFEPDEMTIAIGKTVICRRGGAVTNNASALSKLLAAARAEMLKPAYEITLRVGSGRGRAQYLTGDLTEEYVRINSEYST